MCAARVAAHTPFSAAIATAQHANNLFFDVNTACSSRASVKVPEISARGGYVSQSDAESDSFASSKKPLCCMISNQEATLSSEETWLARRGPALAAIPIPNPTMFILDAYVTTAPRSSAKTCVPDEAPIPSGKFEPDGVYRGVIVGRKHDGSRIVREVNGWKPHIYVRMPASWSETRCNALATSVGGRVVTMPNAKGYDIDKHGRRRTFRYVRISYKDSRSMRNANYMFKVADNGYRASPSKQDPQICRWVCNIMSEEDLDVEEAWQKESEVQDALSADKYAFTMANCVKGSGGIGLEQSLLNFVGASPGEWIDASSLDRCEEQLPPPALRLASFDIEVTSGTAGDPYPRPFPASHRHSDAVVNISFALASFRDGRSVIDDVVVLCLGETEDTPAPYGDSLTSKGHTYALPMPRFVCFDTESELITAFAQIVSEVDVLLGYNSNGFDLPFLYDRANLLRLCHNMSEQELVDMWRNKPNNRDDAFALYKITDEDGVRQMHATMTPQPPCGLHSKLCGALPSTCVEGRRHVFSSSQAGDSDTFRFRCPGLSVVDMWWVLKQNPGLRLSSYKLDVVAERFLGSKKLDIGSYDAIFRAYDRPNPKARGEIAAYCGYDAVLPLLLSDYFNGTLDDLQLCVQTHLPMYRVAQGGMSARLMGRVAWEAQQERVALNGMFNS